MPGCSLKTEQWEETERREVGIYADTTTHGLGAYFVIVYGVTECRKERGRAVEWRERMVHGATIYQAKQMRVADAALLEVVAKGVKALAHIARAEDERISAARRATSRRKRR